MSFTYDNTLADGVSQMRFYLQDNITPGEYFQDEELTFLLTQTSGNVHKAVAEAAHALWVQFTSLSTVAEVDDIRIESRDKAKWFKQVYEEFKDKAYTNQATPIFMGGGDRTTFINLSEGRSKEGRTTTQTNSFFDLDL